jgi:predicted nuclease of predicted toxin-antitoxin system
VRLLADENCHPVLVERLRQSGHDVECVLETTPGADDVDGLARAEHTGRTIITDDRDFGTLLIKRGLANAGVILLRTRNLAPDFKADRIEAAIAAYGAKLSATIVVIEDGGMRVRAARKK